jgi:spore maturation protein CgeB
MQTNNIIICGVLNVKSSSNIWMATSLTRFGINVIPINYRDIVAKYNTDFLRECILYAVKKYNPILTIFCKCNGIPTHIISECNRFCKTCLWFMDSPIVLENLPEVIEHAKVATFSSCTNYPAANVLKRNGVENCYIIPEGIEYGVHHPVEPDEKYKADISFVGTKNEEREDYRIFLENAGYNVKFYGTGYSEWKDEKEWCKICSSSKFVLSIGTFNTIPGYFPGRLFESIGCRTCVLHLDKTNSINDMFEHNKEIIYFKDKYDLLDKIKNISDEKAKEIAENGYKKGMSKYTWDHSVKKLLDIINYKKEGENA